MDISYFVLAKFRFKFELAVGVLKARGWRTADIRVITPQKSRDYSRRSQESRKLLIFYFYLARIERFYG